jgi:hypothetical protein
MAIRQAVEVSKQTGFDYESLDPDTAGYLRIHAKSIRDLGRNTAMSIHLMGLHLSEARKRLKEEGRFLQWIDWEFGWKKSSAYMFINVFEKVQLPNFGSLEGLEIDISALYLIAAPKTPEPARQELLRRAEAGEAITRKKAIAAIDHYKATGSLPPDVGMRQILEVAKQAQQDDSRAPATDDRVITEQQVRRNESLSLISSMRKLTQSEMLRFRPSDLITTFEKYGWSEDLRAMSLQSAIDWLVEFERERNIRYGSRCANA